MCGIFGLLNDNFQALDVQLIPKAVNKMRHRGPDDEGYLFYNTHTGQAAAYGGPDSDRAINLPSIDRADGNSYNLVLGHRRLSILDLTSSGHQPMSSPDGRYWIIFNGEIYNYLELREELRKEGFSFHSNSDTEVLLAAYACWGEAMLPRLVGMFAFGILDTQKQVLFLARDFFGIKPLYYLWTGEKFAFASEIKPLIEVIDMTRRANPKVVYDYLRYSITDHIPETFLEGINQLMPAHCLVVDLRHLIEPSPMRYWNLDLSLHSNLSFEDAAQEIRRLFLENIKLHLRSDVPVGSCLSGGIDSSAIVMNMRHMAGVGLNLQTFGYVAEEPKVNEEHWMDLVASHAQASLHKVRFGPEDLPRDLDRMIYLQEVPFISTSMYAQYRVFQLAHEVGMKVMEDGQGSDEILAGYQPYVAARIASLISGSDFGRAVHLFSEARKLGLSPSLLIRRSFGFLMPHFARQYARHITGGNAFLPWINAGWFSSNGVSEVDPFEKKKSFDYLRQDLALATSFSSLPMLLRYEDRNSMAFSIESRVPFLTPSFVQFVFTLPEEYVLDDGALTKAVFRKAMRGLVPDPILDRRDKIGFATPEKEMLSSLDSWVQDIFKSPEARQIKAIRMDTAQVEWQRIMNGQKVFGFHIWRMLNLIKWSAQYQVQFI